jgi:sodium/bile acid cotransporter 7
MSAQSIIFVAFFNIGLYITLTVVCFFAARPPQILYSRGWSKSIFKPLSPEQAIAVCFCGPAKSTALGIPLLYAMWEPLDLYTKAKTSVPVLLYTTEQIAVAHLFVQMFKRWHARVVEKQDVEQGHDDEVDMEMAEASVETHGILNESGRTTG